MPDVQPAANQVPAGAVQGSDYGGHAPLVGAHVFVLQIGTGGYGSNVSSLLSANETTTDYYGNVFTTAQDTTTGSPTNGMYYITTSNIGTYALSGDYTCTAGLPVYLYASGGNPNTTPAVTLTSINSVPGTGSYAGGTLSTFTNSGTNLLYQGEMVTFSGITGANAGFNGLTLPVVSTGLTAGQALTTSQFTVYYSLGAFTNSQTFGAGATAYQSGTNAPNNPAVVNLALLGNCPGGGPVTITAANGIEDANGKLLVIFTTTGNTTLKVGQSLTFSGLAGAYGAFNGTTQTISPMNFGPNTFAVELGPYGGSPGSGANTGTATPSATASNFSSLPFLYMNEVSTVAAAYALAPFASVSAANNDALHIGTSSTNLAGLQNAVLNAANLYDIGGSIIGTGGDGDTHIARAVTPTNSGGVVPQALLNTLGNLLANCVDSANTYNGAYATGGVQSAQCAALMNNATSDGTTSGTKPNDTATAMLNIAHYPAGEPSGNTTFMPGLFNSLSGNQPFQPSLGTAPNDFSVGISYSGNGINSPGNVAIDANGNAWITGSGNVVELSPSGSPISGTNGYTASSGYQNRSPVIDLSGNLWYVTTTGAGAGFVGEMNSGGYVVSGAGYDAQTTIQPYSLAVDFNNNIWVENSISSAADSYHAYVTQLNQSGSVVKTVDANPTMSNTSGSNVLQGPTGIGLDGNGLIWIDGSASGNVASINTSSGNVTWYANTSSTASNSPDFLALDQNNKLWVPNLSANFVQTVTPSAATNTGANTYSYSYPTYTGGGLNQASAAAVDGANNVWVMSFNQKNISEFSNPATGTPTALTPATGYTGGFSSTGSNGGNRLAIDGSGNIWMPISGGNNVIEMIGIASPVMTPMVAAAKTGTPSIKP